MPPPAMPSFIFIFDLQVVAAKKTKVEVITRPTMITSPSSQLTAGQQHIQLPANVITKIVTNNNATLAAQQQQQKFFTPTSITTPVSTITSVNKFKIFIADFYGLFIMYLIYSVGSQYLKLLFIIALWKQHHQ